MKNSARSSSKSVLIVEDDHDTRVSLRQSLEEAGYFVLSAPDGAAALRLLKQTSIPDFILLDIMMPLMNGDQFLEIVAKDPILSRIPIIQMSAANSPRRLGTLCAFSKPLDFNLILNALSTYQPSGKAGYC